MENLILVTDIGSTKTKALLIQNQGARLSLVAAADEPTTVESPHEDVGIGLFRAVDRMGAEAHFPLREGKKLAVPYYTTSSAGGGLQILVIGLSAADTGQVASAATMGAGGVLLGCFTIDDKVPKVEKIQRMSALSPDLVLMAGGHEGGAIAGVVNMAQLLTEAAPSPKFGPRRLPVVFCGNTAARVFVKETLKERFDVHVTDNIRPSAQELNLRPAIETAQRLFMEHVMQMAPGYQAIADAASVPVIPTPTGVERLLRLLSAGRDENVVLVDMGGATTDVFSVIDGQIERTVSANTGMSFSLSNILKDVGSEAMMRHLDGVDEAPAKDRVLEKTLFPTIHAGDEFGLAVEHALAAEGIGLAFRQHIRLCYLDGERKGIFSRIKSCPFDFTFRTKTGATLKLSDVGTIIGAGGVLAHASNRRAAWILAQGFNPRGVTTLAVDSKFHSPHMGVLSTSHPELALDHYSTRCLEKVCRVITPAGKVREGRPAMKLSGRGTSTSVEGGDFLFVPDGCGLIAGDWEEKESIPLLIDCRRDPLQTFPLDFEKPPIELSSAPPSHHRQTTLTGPEDMTRTFSLAYPGEIEVSPGDKVQPGTLIGQNRLSPPQVYFVDVRRGSKYLAGVSTEEAIAGITVKPGDKVTTGMEVFRLDTRKGITGAVHTMSSPVRGIVTDIIPPGVIRVTELQDYDGKPHTVDIARALGIKPRHVPGHLKVREGDFVQREQLLATGKGSSSPPPSFGQRLPMATRQGSVFVKSPATGTVKKIDTDTGEVTIQYITNPIRLESPIHGTITEVRDNTEVDVSFRATTIEGVLALGRDAYGPLALAPEKGSLSIVRGPISREDIDKSLSAGAAAIIGASISAELISSYLGHTPGVLLTGEEELPASLMVLRGVGEATIESEQWKVISSLVGRHGALFTTTRLRAGVERPKLLVQ